MSDLTILNHGGLTGVDGQAIDAIGSSLDLSNSGAIHGTHGVELGESTATSFVNTGSISGDVDGIHQHSSELTGSNSGTISGVETGFSVHDSSTLDFVNSGRD